MKTRAFIFKTGLTEIKLEKKEENKCISLGMIHGNSLKLIPYFWSIFADVQNQVFSSNLNVSAKIRDSSFEIENNLSLENQRYSSHVMLR